MISVTFVELFTRCSSLGGCRRSRRGGESYRCFEEHVSAVSGVPGKVRPQTEPFEDTWRIHQCVRHRPTIRQRGKRRHPTGDVNTIYVDAFVLVQWVGSERRVNKPCREVARKRHYLDMLTAVVR